MHLGNKEIEPAQISFIEMMLENKVEVMAVDKRKILFGPNISNIPEYPLIEDILHLDGRIFVSEEDMSYMVEEKPAWFPEMAWPKRMKDGRYIYHIYQNPKPRLPQKAALTLNERKRRFLYGVMLDNGNPTWKNVDDFKIFITEYDKATDDEEIKSLICNKFCYKCKRVDRSNDIAEDATTLYITGFKG